MTITENTGFIVRIVTKDGVEITKIEFNDTDVTDKLDGDILRLPAINSSSKLRIYRTGKAGVKAIGSECNASHDVFNLQGLCIKRNATDEDIKALNPGLYIINGKKVMIHKN